MDEGYLAGWFHSGGGGKEERRDNSMMYDTAITALMEVDGLLGLDWPGRRGHTPHSLMMDNVQCHNVIAL